MKTTDQWAEDITKKVQAKRRIKVNSAGRYIGVAAAFAVLAGGIFAVGNGAIGGTTTQIAADSSKISKTDAEKVIVQNISLRDSLVCIDIEASDTNDQQLLFIQNDGKVYLARYDLSSCTELGIRNSGSLLNDYFFYYAQSVTEIGSLTGDELSALKSSISGIDPDSKDNALKTAEYIPHFREEYITLRMGCYAENKEGEKVFTSCIPGDFDKDIEFFTSLYNTVMNNKTVNKWMEEYIAQVKQDHSDPITKENCLAYVVYADQAGEPEKYQAVFVRDDGKLFATVGDKDFVGNICSELDDISNSYKNGTMLRNVSVIGKLSSEELKSLKTFVSKVDISSVKRDTEYSEKEYAQVRTKLKDSPSFTFGCLVDGVNGKQEFTTSSSSSTNYVTYETLDENGLSAYQILDQNEKIEKWKKDITVDIEDSYIMYAVCDVSKSYTLQDHDSNQRSSIIFLKDDGGLYMATGDTREFYGNAYMALTMMLYGGFDYMGLWNFEKIGQISDEELNSIRSSIDGIGNNCVNKETKVEFDFKNGYNIDAASSVGIFRDKSDFVLSCADSKTNTASALDDENAKTAVNTFINNETVKKYRQQQVDDFGKKAESQSNSK